MMSKLPITRSRHTLDRRSLTTMDSELLARLCQREWHRYRNGATYNEVYIHELFRRVFAANDSIAKNALERLFTDLVQGWIVHYPQWEDICGLYTQESCVEQTLLCFWQLADLSHHQEFTTLQEVLQTLQIAFNTTLLNAVRQSSAQKRAIQTDKDQTEATTEGESLWNRLQTLLPDARQQRLAFLLFHCGLEPREIVQHCPDEFSDLAVIHRLRVQVLLRLAQEDAGL